MGNKSVFPSVALFVTTMISSYSAISADYLVNNQTEYKQALKKVVAGDSVILANGTWSDFNMVFRGEGTKGQPIKLLAQEKGKVFISGRSSLRLAGRHLHVEGLVFKDGYSPRHEVVSFRVNKENLAYDSRVTEVVIDEFNKPDRQESDYWVGLYGQRNRLDHSVIQGKRNKGVTVAVRLNSKNSQQNYHSIDHNYFGPRPVFGSNGGETLRIGTSHYSLSDSFTSVKNNVFEKTDGEVEIISVKSGNNIIDGNLFLQARGTLTLRHGNGNQVINNVFKGDNIPHTGGIRIINADQRITNNYMEGLTGHRFGSGFTIMNGVPNSPINRYHQVDNAQINNNSIINVKHIELASGSDPERSAKPINSSMSNNLLFNENGKSPFRAHDDVCGIRFNNNLSNYQDDVTQTVASTVKLERAANGLLYPISGDAGVSRNLQPITKAETGPSWYRKTPLSVELDSGKTIKVSAVDEALKNAISSANSGDTLVLSAGHYDVGEILYINKPLSIIAGDSGVKISYQMSTLFEIRDGGSLRLDGLEITGGDAPDSHGNSVVRTQKWGMLENYRLIMTNNQFIDLDINKFFYLFNSGKGAFADEITFNNNKVDRVSGDLFKLTTEIEDRGIYNVEYLNINDNEFTNVKGSIVDVYRGGKDESTFGPHLYFYDNQVQSTSNTPALLVHGGQDIQIKNNDFNSAHPVQINHTVGEPIVTIENNKMQAEPKLTELYSGHVLRAKVVNNVIH